MLDDAVVLPVPVKSLLPDADRVVNSPVEAVVEPIGPGLANVAPLREDAFKFGIFVVDDTTNGGVPVITVEVNWPVTERDVPVAAPITGVINVGVFAKTTEPVPVAVVDPVPPFKIGKAVPERVNASVPDEVIGEPEIDRKAGTVAATEVTVPVVGVDHVITEAPPPADVKTCPLVPAVVGILKL